MGRPGVTTEADKAPPAIELIGIDKSFGPVHANNHVDLVVERGVDPRHRRRERRRQVDADVDPLRLLRGRRRRNPRSTASRSAIRSSRERDRRRHRHGASAFHAGRRRSACSRTSCSAPRAAGCSPRARATARAGSPTSGANTASSVDPDAIVGELSVGLQQRVEILKALYRGARHSRARRADRGADAGGGRPAVRDAQGAEGRSARRSSSSPTSCARSWPDRPRVGDAARRDGRAPATPTTTSPPRARRRDGRAQGAAEDREGPRPSGQDRARGAKPVVRDERGVVRVDGVSFILRAGEIVGVAGVAGNGQIGAPRSARRHAPAQRRRDPRRRRAVDARAKQPARGASHRHRPCAGGPPPRRPHHAVRRPAKARCSASMQEPRIRQRRAVRPPGDHRRPRSGKWKHSTSGRASPLLKTAELLRRQSAEDRAGARDRAQSQGPAGRAADARRRHRRDRIHPPAHCRPCATPARRRLLVSVELDEIFALSDRIIVLCAGRITGERRPEDTNAQDLGPLMAGVSGARGMSAPLRPLPIWADVALIPLINVAAAFVISGFVVLAIGENPLEAVQILIYRRPRRSRRHRIHALLRHQFHLHRPCGRHLLPRRAVQHRRRGPSLCRGPWRGAGGAPSRLPARLFAGHRRDPRRRPCSARRSRSFPATFRPSATATSSSRRSCSITSPRP